jgi:hypothetical protein
VDDARDIRARLPTCRRRGFPSAHVELYLARGAERPAIQVSCAGTLVADDIGELHALDLDAPPWVGSELSGLIDFPGFTVPPGSRRGVVPDRAAEAFARAMSGLRPLVESELKRLERERRAAADRPHLVDAAGETWRSRFDGRRWEVNQMHEDYLALKSEARARLRYLFALLAKDLSQHAHRVPGAVESSEDVVAILALAERNLRGA